jgi:CHAD domain-containing protein
VAYRFDPDEGVRKAVRRCAREQLDDAVRQLSEQIEHDPVEAVHEARKGVKKSRALLRLMRGTLPDDQRRHENAALRDASRGLSDARDADVMTGTIRQLADDFAGQVPKRTFRAVHDKLEAARPGTIDPAASAAAVRDLRAALERIDEWELSRGGWGAISPGLAKSYGRGRRALAEVRAEPSLENLHEWRKRVKDLWYQLRLLQQVCGPVVHGQVKEADQLADLLGDDHDLGVLRQTVSANSDALTVDVDALLALIDHRRGQLQEHAVLIGERLYAEPTKAFRRRLHSYWSAGRTRSRAERRRRPAALAGATRSVHTAA